MMKAFFITVCAFAVVIGAYCYLSPLPSMRARYRCFSRHDTIHSVADKISTNFMNEADLGNLTDQVATQYRQAVTDGNVMAKQYAVAQPLTVVLCALLFGTGLVGLGFERKRKNSNKALDDTGE